MDIQLFATDEELREFPEHKIEHQTESKTILENKTDFNTVPASTSSPNSINLMTSDLPRSHTDLPKCSSSLPVSKTKCRTKGSRRCKSQSNTKILVGGHSVVQVNDCLGTIQEKQLVVQSTNVAYLGQSFSHSLNQPMVASPVVSQLGPGQSRSSADQPSHPIRPLLSLQLQPNLNVLAQTLSPEALRYVHLGIQISRNLLIKL